MSDVNIAGRCTPMQQVDSTLWYCHHCSAIVSIQCTHAVREAFCPACVEGPLEFCGHFSGIPGLQLGNA
jgi:hypothetical protein